MSTHIKKQDNNTHTNKRMGVSGSTSECSYDHVYWLANPGAECTAGITVCLESNERRVLGFISDLPSCQSTHCSHFECHIEGRGTIKKRKREREAINEK